MVDFNHPLSGKNITYKIKINRVVTDDKEKVKSYIALALNFRDVDVDIKEGVAEITSKKEVPAEIQESIIKKQFLQRIQWKWG